MRITRLIAALVAMALMAPAAIALTSGVSAAAEAAQQAKPQHDLVAKGKEIGNTNKFVAYGHVSTYTDRFVTIQRKNCVGCKWKFYKKTRTSADAGKFRARIARGEKVPSRICYRVNVPPTPEYRRTIAPVGCIKTRRG
jgi:hypothetical protein